jgi:hypothetical protein
MASRFRIPLKPLIALIVIGVAGFHIVNSWLERQMLQQVIERLTADSRVAEVLVTKVGQDPATGKVYTTIKFMEYDADLKPLAPRYFTFASDIIQFQSLVIRFDDFYIKKGHPLKGKSAYIFMKAFAFMDQGAQVFDINKVNEIPSGYEIEGVRDSFTKKLWQRFWRYALDPKEAKNVGIKNAQIEAPGTKFIPGLLYTIKIEHDGGLRIDTQALPEILKGESINFK